MRGAHHKFRDWVGERASLGAHKDNDILKSKMSSIEGRKLTVYMFPIEADDWTSTSYWELGRFRIAVRAAGPSSTEPGSRRAS